MIELRREGQVQILRLDRPAVRNALDAALTAELARSFAALGGGLMLAAACDLVVTERDARWRLPEVGLGFFPPWGLEALVARVGISRARLIVFGHQPLDGARALELGLADCCVAPGAAEAEAYRLDYPQKRP